MANTQTYKDFFHSNPFFNSLFVELYIYRKAVQKNSALTSLLYVWNWANVYRVVLRVLGIGIGIFSIDFSSVWNWANVYRVVWRVLGILLGEGNKIFRCNEHGIYLGHCYRQRANNTAIAAYYWYFLWVKWKLLCEEKATDWRCTGVAFKGKAALYHPTAQPADMGNEEGSDNNQDKYNKYQISDVKYQI